MTFEAMERLRFTGDVWTLPEGRVFFKDEPSFVATAPLLKLSWSRRLSSTKSTDSRSLPRRQLSVFIPQASGRCGFRFTPTPWNRCRDESPPIEYLAGFAGTSNVLAGKTYEIPTVEHGPFFRQQLRR